GFLHHNLKVGLRAVHCMFYSDMYSYSSSVNYLSKGLLKSEATQRFLKIPVSEANDLDLLMWCNFFICFINTKMI
ncbi:MAG: hypothetical protein OEW99_14480, partial [Gammaproteobacteria bacterium]|nr:hypothetical protein [Gammaproteobacteria bacterium]